MALLAWMGMFIRLETMRDVAIILVLSMPVSMPNCLWHFKIMAISSSDVLPARSPTPFMVTSTWRAPFKIPAMVLAVAMPKSLWQWVEIMALSMLQTLFTK